MPTSADDHPILSEVPRHRLAHLPTPFERLDRLTEALAGPQIWIKRDDCTGLATGGNKARKLEFLVADALRRGCDTLVTVGKIQSNHARQTAAAAAKVGMHAVLLLEQLPANDTEPYRTNGNSVLNSILGAEVRVLPPGGLSPETTAAVLDELRASGATPAFVPVGGSDEVGSVGYVAAGIELDRQLAQLALDPAAVIMASGSGGTQGGLVLGLHTVERAIDVVGFSVSDPADKQRAKVINIADRCATHLGCRPIDPSLVIVEDSTLGPGYGQPDRRTLEAIQLFASTEGIVLDPVYTGKAAAGLVEGCRSGRFTAAQQVVFLHTGGQAGAFAYQPVFG